MAVDEALLSAPPDPDSYTLRLYRWHRPTVSLGYAQPWLQGFDRARAADVALVRRPTGGRAVLHADELTYAVAGPADPDTVGTGILSCYRTIATGLAAGVRELGGDVRLARGARGDSSGSGACFSARSRYELTFGGRKLAGSAQRRQGGRFLQHGSLPLGDPDPRLWSALGPGGREAAHASVGLVRVLGYRPSWRLLASVLARNLAHVLGARPAMASLTGRERRAAALYCERHSDPLFVRRR